MRPGLRGSAGKAVLVRLSAEEHRTLSEAARRAGLGVGTWLRMLGLRESEPPAKSWLEEDMEEDRPAPAPRRVASRRGKT